jgi:hypothetical protein
LDKVSVAAVVSTDVIMGTGGNEVVQDPPIVDIVGTTGTIVWDVGITGASDVVLVILTTRLDRGRRVAIVSWYFKTFCASFAVRRCHPGH